MKAKRIAITGAGSGLGQALALRYGQAGWRVAVTDIDPERSAAVADQVEQGGGSALPLGLDTRSVEDYQTLTEQLQSQWGGVDVWINNAGVAGAGTLLDSSLEDWHWMLDVNLMGVVHGARAALPLLRTSRGHLVNIASFAAIASTPGMAAYNATKAAVFSLSETIRAEEYDNGVGVNVVCPAFFATNLMQTFRGPAKAKATMVHLMDKARVTAADVAADVFDAVEQRRFLVISHEIARRQYQLKRDDPEAFFQEILAATRSFIQP